MAHVSNFTQAGDKIVLDMINEDNNSFFTLATISIARGVAAPVTLNSTALLTALEGSGYTGTDSVEYNRLQLQEFADLYFEDGLVVQLGDAVSAKDLFDEINTALGTNLVLGTDLADLPIPAWEGIPNEQKEIVLPVLESSLVYLGSLTFKVDGNEIPLSSVITTKVLTGLNLPVVAPE